MEAREACLRELVNSIDKRCDSKRKWEMDAIIHDSSNPAIAAYCTQQVVSIEKDISEKEDKIKRLRTTEA